MRRKYRLNRLLIFCLLFSLLPSFGHTAALANEPLGGTVTETVYAVSQDGSKRVKLDYINFNVNTPGEQKSNYIALYTSGTEIVNNTVYTNKILVKKFNVAISVDSQGAITDVIGPSSLPISSSTQWEADQYVDIPKDGFVLIASDSSWNTAPKYRASLFDMRGSSIHLERGGEIIVPSDLLVPSLKLTTLSGTTVTTATYTVEGRISQFVPDLGLSVKVGESYATVQANGSFSQPVTLIEGSNNIYVKLFKNETLLQEQIITLAYQKQSADLIEIEAPPDDITIIVEGPKKKIDYIDKDVTGISNIFALYTTEFGPSIQIPTVNVAIQVDATGHVTRMVNPSVNGGTPSWTVTPTDLEIPQGGYVVMAQDNSYANNFIKRYLATKFKVGDIAKLRKNGNVIPVTELMTGQGQIPRLVLDNLPLYTIKETTTSVTGKVTNPDGASVTIDNLPVPVQPDGTFSYLKQLTAGPNYMDVVLNKNNVQFDKKSIVVYSKPDLPAEKQVILWVDQASNARKLQSSASVLDFLRKAKDAGVTDIAFDVKGVEGFVSYKKNELTNRPYVSEMTAPERSGSNPDLDLLEEFITHSRTLNLKIHAAFNVFAEGSIAVKDFAVIDQHLDWEEQVYRSDDNGQIKRLRESEYGKRGLAGNANGALVLFVNPANDQVRDYQLKTFEEVLKNYDVDGIILDRGRYDNETADFSDVTKAKFTTFLQQRGKQLNNWPDDVFRYVNGKRTDGPLIQDWWEFRSGTIESFVKETNDLVEKYETSKNRTIQTSAYVGAWFESYYLNGVHWGSKDFRYDSRLGFPTSSIYTPEYYKTGYIGYLDFLMVGTYYSTVQEIQRYITIDTIVTNGEVPIYAGMALTDLQSPALQKEIFQNAMGSSNGLMLFDASLANWPVVKASLNNQVYVKDYQIGISKPGDPNSFVEGSYYNVSRNTNDINVYNEEFGTSTGTNKFGVEVVTDATGKVTEVVNKTQASTWNWSVPQDNNRSIPQGGMVVSAIDQSGIRTNRQLLANTYSAGDDIRAAALSGYMAYDGQTVTNANPDLSGNVKVMGAGSTVTVSLNGSAATVSANGDFTGKAVLQPGVNTVTFAVYVDGMKTNEKSIQMTYNPPVLMDLVVSGSNGQLVVGEASQLKVEAFYSDSSKIDITTEAIYSSSNPNVASVAANGLIRAIRAGQTTISVDYMGKKQTIPINVSVLSPTAALSGVIMPPTAVETTVIDGKPAVEIMIDAEMVGKAAVMLESLGKKAPELIVEVKDDVPIASITISAQALDRVSQLVKGALLIVKAGGVTYQMPADSMELEAVSKELDAQAEDVQVVVTLEKKTDAEAEAIKAVVEAKGGLLMGDAYQVNVSASVGSKTIELDFGRKSKKDILLSFTLPNTYTKPIKAFEFDQETGNIGFVPVQLKDDGGLTSASIKHVTNSTYIVAEMDKEKDHKD